jgi:uncharacterized protein
VPHQRRKTARSITIALPPLAIPNASPQRIECLDILRGFALLGMFIVHFHMQSTEPGGFDDVVRTLIWRLVESKSHGTFALLFGAGFAIQLRRAEAHGRPFAGIYLRRLAVLALFGLAAHAFFGYNVLLGYAVWAMPLLVIRQWSTRALLETAVVSAASVVLYSMTTTWLLCNLGPDCVAAAAKTRRAEAIAVNRALEAAEIQASYLLLLSARLRHMAWFYAQPFFVMPGATLALFIAGFLFVRHRVFDEARAHHRLLGAMAAFGVVSWVLDNWLLPTGLGLVRDQWLTFTYVAGGLLLLAHVPALTVRLRPVGAAGRMALTNYLLQIATLDFLFSGYALGLGKIRPVFGFLAALACFAAEAAFSTIWLKHFHFGPAEWLWRSLTYGQRQPMRRPSVSPEPETVSA